MTSDTSNSTLDGLSIRHPAVNDAQITLDQVYHNDNL
jgi:hypothetical protein